jgi:hypothetical protein
MHRYPRGCVEPTLAHQPRGMWQRLGQRDLVVAGAPLKPLQRPPGSASAHARTPLQATPGCPQYSIQHTSWSSRMTRRGLGTPDNPFPPVGLGQVCVCSNPCAGVQEGLDHHPGLCHPSPGPDLSRLHDPRTAIAALIWCVCLIGFAGGHRGEGGDPGSLVRRGCLHRQLGVYQHRLRRRRRPCPSAAGTTSWPGA